MSLSDLPGIQAHALYIDINSGKIIIYIQVDLKKSVKLTIWLGNTNGTSKDHTHTPVLPRVSEAGAYFSEEAAWWPTGKKNGTSK